MASEVAAGGDSKPAAAATAAVAAAEVAAGRPTAEAKVSVEGAATGASTNLAESVTPLSVAGATATGIVTSPTASPLRSKSETDTTKRTFSVDSAERSNFLTQAQSPHSAGSNRQDLRRSGSTGHMIASSKASTSPSHRRRSSHDVHRQNSISKLKTAIRVRRSSLKAQGEGGNTLVAEKNVNFAPIGGTKFHEALAITLQREQEGNNKYRIVKRLKKYRGMRSDSKAENRARKQKKRIEKRQRKGQKQKTKDIIHKQHEQYALTYGMMLGVQMSVGRQFEFSAKRSLNSMSASSVTSMTTDLDSEIEAATGRSSKHAGAEELEADARPESLVEKVHDAEHTGHAEHARMSSLRQFSSAGQKRESMGIARAQSKEGSSVAVDSSTGEVISTPSLNEMKQAAKDAKMRNLKMLRQQPNASSKSRPKMRRQPSDRDTGIRGDMDSHAHQLRMTDFMAVDKYVFPLSISSMNSDFKFKDYAPLAFRKLRNFWGVEKYEYLLSVCPPDQGFINFISNSKSGQYFFFSHDMKYMIKTLSDDECKFLRRILPHYVRHMTTNPNSLINRYYGLHRVKMPHIRRKLHFVVMNNIFLTPKPIHTKYDLKGATYHGRYVATAKIASKSSSSSVRKDLNWMGFTDDKSPGKKTETQPRPEHKQWLRIGDPRRKLLFAEQVARDAVFLAEMKIMDYSLLVGVHGRDSKIVPGYSLGIPDEEEESDDFEEEMSEEGDDEDAADLNVDHYGEPTRADLVNSPGGRAGDGSTKNSEAFEDGGVGSPPFRTSTESGVWLGENEARGNVPPDDEDSSTPLSIFQQDHGGFEGQNQDGTPNNEIYYVGIIDILQQYNVKKWGENKLKGWFTDQGTKKISAVPPKDYARRFINFIAKSIK